MASLPQHVRAAADLIAREAEVLAARWSAQIPGSVTVKGGGDSVTISSAVGPSYPNEVAGVVHPVYGPTARNPWPGHVLNQYRPFLAPAADAKADAAAEEIGKYIDDVAHEAGFR